MLMVNVSFLENKKNCCILDYLVHSSSERRLLCCVHAQKANDPRNVEHCDLYSTNLLISASS